MNGLVSSLRRTLHTELASKTFVRYESSARRHTKALRQHPHSSMRITPESPAADHIIYNPPSAAPTPLITPRLFLPKNDPRRAVIPEPVLPEGHRMPPPIRKPYEKSYHLTPPDFEKIRELREQGMSRLELARKFNASPLFIGMIAEASPEKIAAEEKRREKTKAKWGINRTLAREERAKRRAGWYGADGL